MGPKPASTVPSAEQEAVAVAFCQHTLLPLAEYNRESILEETKAGQQLVTAQGKHIGRPKGLDADNPAKVRKALDKGLSVAETVAMTGSSLSSVKRYRKHLQAALT